MATQETKETSKYSHYKDALQKIFDGVKGDFQAYKRLEHLCVKIGHRLSGSDQLEDALTWFAESLKTDGFSNVREEKVMIPHWVRGEESAAILSPRPIPIAILGIGLSVGTPAEGVTGSVVVVKDFHELEALGEEKVRGKIVLYNAPFERYVPTVHYRSRGAPQAAKMGAIAVLVRSVTPYSLYTPHTGTQNDPSSIPAACVTIEDAELIARMVKDGEVIVNLKMSCKTLPDRASRNVLAEIPGSEHPDEVVVVSGHVDSWDVGQGAHDDGQGCCAAWEAARIIMKLGLKPRRTIRVVLFTDEEVRSSGADAYLEAHKDEIDKHQAAIETDVGVFRAIGFGCTGSPTTKEVARELIGLLSPVCDGKLDGEGDGVDISPLIEHGVPGFLLKLEPEWWNSKYFHYHHTNADTIDKVDPAWLLQNVQVLAGLVYLLADIPERLPQAKPESRPEDI